MAISAEVISRAIYDKPIQPLFNTIYMSSIKAGVPVIVTNTNNNLRVTAKATVGSVERGTPITDSMFESNTSGIQVDGFLLNSNTYFTLLDLESDISELPNEFRTDAAGMDDAAFMEVLVVIGNRISEKIISDFFLMLPPTLTSLVPSDNIQAGYAGKIEWDTTKTPESGKKSISEILKDITNSLPQTMLPGGTAEKLVTTWISSRDFITMSTSVKEAYQPHPNGGVGSTYFQYVKDASTLEETRNMFAQEILRYGNMIILPWAGLAPDTVITTYQEGVRDAKVFYEKVPAGLLNNMYMVLRGAFIRNDGLSVPVAEGMQQAFFDIPYQVGNLFTVNKVENAMLKYKILGDFAPGLLLRESDKLFAVLPSDSEQPETPTLTVTPDSVEFVKDGESKAVTIDPATGWETVSKPDWITSVTASAIVAAENTTGASRVGTVLIRLTANQSSVGTITVSQAGV